MADDLATPSGIELVLIDTADYDVSSDLDKARRRVAALRRKLDAPMSSARGDRSLAFQMQIIENQLSQALAFVRSNETLTDAQRLANPSVVHADFQTCRGYANTPTNARVWP